MAQDEQPLFPSSLISPDVISSLPDSYNIRPLYKSDFHNGFLDVLRVLTTVGNISEAQFEERYDLMAGGNITYYILVVCDGSGIIVATGALVVERKFLQNLALIGHVEDISVAKEHQGKKLGFRMLQALHHIAKELGCSKSILDCSEATEGFYEKCGFKRVGLQMAHTYDTTTTA